MNSELQDFPDNVIREEYERRFQRKKGERLQSSKASADHMRAFLSKHPGDVEHFGIVYLDTQLNIIHSELVSSGSLSTASVFPREIIKRVLALESGSILCFHNHPSLKIHPSNSDRVLTKKLQTALTAIDVQLLDHIIIGDGFYSFSDHGLL